MLLHAKGHEATCCSAGLSMVLLPCHRLPISAALNTEGFLVSVESHRTIEDRRKRHGRHCSHAGLCQPYRHLRVRIC